MRAAERSSGPSSRKCSRGIERGEYGWRRCRVSLARQPRHGAGPRAARSHHGAGRGAVRAQSAERLHDGRRAHVDDDSVCDRHGLSPAQGGRVRAGEARGDRGRNPDREPGAVGYRKRADRRLEPDPVAAPVVRRVFEERAKGAGPTRWRVCSTSLASRQSAKSPTWSEVGRAAAHRAIVSISASCPTAGRSRAM